MDPVIALVRDGGVVGLVLVGLAGLQFVVGGLGGVALALGFRAPPGLVVGPSGLAAAVLVGADLWGLAGSRGVVNADPAQRAAMVAFELSGLITRHLLVGPAFLVPLLITAILAAIGGIRSSPRDLVAPLSAAAAGALGAAVAAVGWLVTGGLGLGIVAVATSVMAAPSSLGLASRPVDGAEAPREAAAESGLVASVSGLLAIVFAAGSWESWEQLDAFRAIAAIEPDQKGPLMGTFLAEQALPRLFATATVLCLALVVGIAAARGSGSPSRRLLLATGLGPAAAGLVLAGETPFAAMYGLASSVFAP